MGSAIQILYNLAKKGFKFSLIISFIMLFISFFGDYVIFAVYHLNLGLYYFFGGFLGNDTILLLGVAIVFMFGMFLYKLVRKFI